MMRTPEEQWPEVWLFAQIAQRFGEDISDELWDQYRRHQSHLADVSYARHKIPVLVRRLERLRANGASEERIARVESQKKHLEGDIRLYTTPVPVLGGDIEAEIIRLLQADTRLTEEVRRHLIEQVQAAYKEIAL